jgi:hypothetical protein
MHLAALAPFGSVPTGPLAAFGRALQGAAVEDHRAGLWGTPLAEADQHPQVGDDRLEDPGLDPPPGLLVDGGPGRQIGGHEAPLEAGAGDVAQAVEEFAQGMGALRGILTHQGEVGSQEGPFLIADVGGIAGAGCGIHTGKGTAPHPQSA